MNGLANPVRGVGVTWEIPLPRWLRKARFDVGDAAALRSRRTRQRSLACVNKGVVRDGVPVAACEAEPGPPARVVTRYAISDVGAFEPSTSRPRLTLDGRQLQALRAAVSLNFGT